MTDSRRSTQVSLVLVALALLTAAGLAIDAYVHLDRASIEPPAYGGHISESALFYIEGVVSAVAALLVLVFRRRWAFALAFVVSLTAFAAVLVTRYYNIGAIGPIPNLYEPAWYPAKTLSAVAEAAATLTAGAGFVFARSLSAQRRSTREEAVHGSP